MKKDINIAEILKDMPEGTELYSPVYGKCKLYGVNLTCVFSICVTYDKESYTSLTSKGHLTTIPDTACILFPSKHMTDWTKFAWKKGDILVSNDGKREVIFDHFNIDNEYYTFIGRHLLYTEEDGCQNVTDKGSYMTAGYSIEEKDAAQCYINTLEERLGGKLNPDTLDMEKKDEHIFKPFEKVLVRDYDNERWNISLFAYKEDADVEAYTCLNDTVYGYCIPYEGNEHLLGTTDSPRNL